MACEMYFRAIYLRQGKIALMRNLTWIIKDDKEQHYEQYVILFGRGDDVITEESTKRTNQLEYSLYT